MDYLLHTCIHINIRKEGGRRGATGDANRIGDLFLRVAPSWLVVAFGVCCHSRNYLICRMNFFAKKILVFLAACLRSPFS
jgi:hypothetical protein